MSELVLLHGVGLNGDMWRRCIASLGTRHRARALDLLGHGGAGPAAPGTTLADLGDAVAAQLRGATHVVGFSLGALVAQQLALDHPELVRSLVLVSSVAARTPAQASAVGERLDTAERNFPAAVDAAVDRWLPQPSGDAEIALAEKLRAALLSNDHVSYLTCYRIFATADQQLRPQLPRIVAPTLAITGEADPGSTPEMTHRLAAAIPRARAVIVPGVRHLLPLQAPAVLAQHILIHTLEVDHATTASPALHRR
jgi:pimeloyl-ACP methyl ester carboxylesterase